MSCQKHGVHDHEHGPSCGHPPVRHGDHVDYLHEGHLHSSHGDHVDDHSLDVDQRRPSECAPIECDDVHGDGACRHPVVPHGDHADYAVEGALHHRHGDHCDLHGIVDRR